MIHLFACVLVVATVGSPVPKPAPPTAKELNASRNNLLQIGVAGFAYRDTHGFMPQDILDATGKPLLSWRVHLLPYLAEDDLYKQFKFDEAWDGPTNKKLIEKLPRVYAPVRVIPEKGHTFYCGFVGRDDDSSRTAFEPGKKVVFANFRDGTYNTAWVVEAGDSVEWTKPGELPFDPKKDLPKLGGQFDGVFHILTCGGTVERAKKDFDKNEFKKMLTRAGDEIFNINLILDK